MGACCAVEGRTGGRRSRRHAPLSIEVSEAARGGPNGTRVQRRRPRSLRSSTSPGREVQRLRVSATLGRPRSPTELSLPPIFYSYAFLDFSAVLRAGRDVNFLRDAPGVCRVCTSRREGMDFGGDDVMTSTGLGTIASS